MTRLTVFEEQSSLATFETGRGVVARKNRKCDLSVSTHRILEEHCCFGVALLILEVWTHLSHTYSLVYSTFCDTHKMAFSSENGEAMSEQVREHLAEFDHAWEMCFSSRGARRNKWKLEFRKQWTRKMGRMLTVYNNYDTAIHNAQMAEMRENSRKRRLQTENAKLVQEVANLKEEITRLRQNGGAQTEMHRPTGGTGGAQAPSGPNDGPDTGI